MNFNSNSNTFILNNVVFFLFYSTQNWTLIYFKFVLFTFYKGNNFSLLYQVVDIQLFFEII